MDDKLRKLPPGSDDDLRYWAHQIDLGIARRKKESKRWEHNERSLRMDRYKDLDEKHAYIPINKCGSWQKTVRALLAFKSPMPRITPKTPDGYVPVQVPVLGQNGEPMPMIGPDGMPVIDQMGNYVPQTRPVLPYKVLGAVVENIIKHPKFGWEDTIARVINASGVAYGVMKVGYRPEFETPPGSQDKFKVMIDPETRELDFEDYVSDPMDPRLPMFDDKGNPIPKASLPVRDTYFIDWEHYRHLIHDPNGGNDFTKHRWVAVEYLRNIEDVRNDPLYSNTEDLEPYASNVRLSDFDEEGRVVEHDDSDEEWKDRDGLVRLIEIYDMVNDRMKVMADGHGKWLYDDDTPDSVDESPFVFLRMDEDLGTDGEFYPNPPMSSLSPIADGINNMGRLIHIEAKNSLRKWGVPKGKLNVENQDRLESDEDNQVVEFESANYGINESIKLLSSGEGSQSKVMFYNLLNAAFDEAAGLSASLRGKTTDATATEVEKISSGETTRMAFERGILRRSLVQALKKLVDAVQATMTVDVAIQLVGDDGQAFTGMVGKDMIVGDYDVDIDIEEMIPPSGALQGARKQQLLQTMNQNPWPFADPILCEEWCSDMGVTDENFINALAAQAAKQVAIQEAVAMQALMPPAPPQQKVPEAPPPESSADAIAQTGAGQQVPRMQGAT